METFIDRRRVLTITMTEGSRIDFSLDFFSVGSLPMDACGRYMVQDVTYCLDQAIDWMTCRGDYAEDVPYGERNVAAWIDTLEEAED